jgi:hypothetical protein
MIQVNELRVGSFYNYNGNTIKLDGNFLASYLKNDIKPLLQPIPLTEELLLKCGFEKQIGLDDMFYWTLKNKPNRANRFEIFETEGGYETISEAKIEFLHQLQNCYFSHYLDGTELQITP